MEKDKKVFYEVRRMLTGAECGISSLLGSYDNKQQACKKALSLSKKEPDYFFVKQRESSIIYRCKLGEERK